MQKLAEKKAATTANISVSHGRLARPAEAHFLTARPYHLGLTFSSTSMGEQKRTQKSGKLVRMIREKLENVVARRQHKIM